MEAIPYRPPSRRAAFWFAAALLSLVGLYVWEGGGPWAAAPYFAVALICIVQFFFPTILLWVLVAGFSLYGSAIYVSMLVADFVRHRAGKPTLVLRDFDDSLVFVAFVVAVVSVTIAVLFSAPAGVRRWLSRLVQPNKSLERTREG